MLLNLRLGRTACNATNGRVDVLYLGRQQGTHGDEFPGDMQRMEDSRPSETRKHPRSSLLLTPGDPAGSPG